jgi:hypothetical protein
MPVQTPGIFFVICGNRLRMHLHDGSMRATANVMPHPIEHYCQVGMEGRVGEPFGAGPLLSTIEEVLDEGDQANAAFGAPIAALRTSGINSNAIPSCTLNAASARR